jgi:hypothetical protein
LTCFNLLINPFFQKIFDLLSHFYLLPSSAVDDEIVLVYPGPQAEITGIDEFVPVLMEKTKLAVGELQAGDDAIRALEEVVQVGSTAGIFRWVK